MYKPLSFKDFDAYAEYLLDLAKKVRESKRPEYTIGSGNALKNFDSCAEKNGVSPETVNWVLNDKHLDALRHYTNNPGGALSEHYDLRIADVINYFILLGALLHRRDGEDNWQWLDGLDGE